MEPDEAIPTGDDDAIGTAPTAAAATAPQPQGDDGAIPEGPVQEQQDQPKRFGPLGKIVSYLMGEGAVHPQVLQQAAEQIDPESGMSASDRNLMVVEDAAKRGGPDAAWKIVQANRVAYNAKQAFGYAAINGTQQKPPDVKAAVDAANQAAEHVLDGSNANFMVSTGGQITATVKGPDGQPQVFDLSPDQFRQYLNVGGAGQYDKQMQPGGIARTLKTVTQARAPGAQQAPAQQEAPAKMGAGASAPPVGSSAGEETYSPELRSRAWGMFPGAGSQKERAEWLASQQSATDTLKNKVDVAEATGESRENAAKARAAGGTEQQRLKNAGAKDVAETRLKGWQYASDAKKAAAQIAADQKAAHDGNVDARARIETARKAIATKRMTAGELSTDDKALEAQLTQQASQPRQQAPAQQAPQQQAAPAASPGAPPVPGARFYKGQWYTRGANGEAVPYQQ